MMNIKDHPLIIICSLIISAFLAGILGWNYIMDAVEKKIEKQTPIIIEQYLKKNKYPLPFAKKECIEKKSNTSNVMTIIISDDLRDDHNNLIDKNNAPFIVQVTGSVSDAKNYYVYLVVTNNNMSYVQPNGSLGINVDGNFSGYCYLGIKSDKNSLGKPYILTAVIVNQKYGSHEELKRETLVKESNKLKLIRTK